MKRISVFKGIINYIFTVIFAIVFALFLNANVGWFLLFALILAPVLSVFFAWLSSRFLDVKIDIADELMSKNDTANMNVVIKNKSIFPTTPISIKYIIDSGFLCDDKEMLVSVLPRHEKEFDVEFSAVISGLGNVGIKEIKVTDYLGLFSFKIKNIDYTDLKRQVAVIPNMAQISPKDEKIMQTMQMSLHTDDSEETIEVLGQNFGGFPGYDNREYVPGDPIKRINWKQSAKRARLMVRLDDEMTSHGINVVLDSVGNNLDEGMQRIINEAAVENALGIMQVLLKQNYTVNFYVYMNNHFEEYSVNDEKDLENIRIMLARYSFSNNIDTPRVPKFSGDDSKNGVSIYSTPNEHEDAQYILQQSGMFQYTTIYSSAGKVYAKPEKEKAVKNSKFSRLAQMIIPYALAVSLSVILFRVFHIEVLSYWTLIQALLCAGLFAFAFFVQNHKIVGSMIITVGTVILLNIFARIVFADYMTFGQWFMSGGDVVDNNTRYLVSILMIFTVFFALVVYYFTMALYRTSFLMLVSFIPFILSVKVMREIDIVWVAVVVILNMAAFLVHVRTFKDGKKRIEGYFAGLLSVFMYALAFVMISSAIPKQQETKYYHIFELAFMGGNISINLPEEYSDMSEYSGNADNFNNINNRRLYSIMSENRDDLFIYLKKQSFDMYDFKNDRWYGLDEYSNHTINIAAWSNISQYRNLNRLTQAIRTACNYDSEFAKKYGLENVANTYSVEYGDVLHIDALNFQSRSFIVPSRTLRIYSQSQGTEKNIIRSAKVTKSEVFIYNDMLPAYLRYNVEYFDDYESRNIWIQAGGANFTTEESEKMLTELYDLLLENNEKEAANVALAFLNDNFVAKEYALAYKENVDQIPQRIKELALDITKDCTYDWEKAQALADYFYEADFMYDLDYKAPDDSVEYFLFEGKTGTCSDFASAYVLMARSVGLTVRYVEGFVPEEEGEGEFVIRTRCAHAYPEVYIQNLGFVTYEPTNAARYGRTTAEDISGLTSFFVELAFKILITFAMLFGVIITILFIAFIVSPFVREILFRIKLNKMTNDYKIVMFYKRIRDVYGHKYIKNADSLTPFEYANKFENVFAYDISELVLMLEHSIYATNEISNEEIIKAKEQYEAAKKAVKEYKNDRKKNAR